MRGGSARLFVDYSDLKEKKTPLEEKLSREKF